MKKFVTALAALGLTAACVPPQGVTTADLAAFDSAVASVGCDLSEDKHYLPVELQTGIPREKLQEIASYKLSQKEAVSLSNGGIRLVIGSCTPEAETTAA
jgi:hypothetical protein